MLRFTNNVGFTFIGVFLFGLYGCGYKNKLDTFPFGNNLEKSFYNNELLKAYLVKKNSSIKKEELTQEKLNKFRKENCQMYISNEVEATDKKAYFCSKEFGLDVKVKGKGYGYYQSEIIYNQGKCLAEENYITTRQAKHAFIKETSSGYNISKEIAEDLYNLKKNGQSIFLSEYTKDCNDSNKFMKNEYLSDKGWKEFILRYRGFTEEHISYRENNPEIFVFNEKIPASWTLDEELINEKIKGKSSAYKWGYKAGKYTSKSLYMGYAIAYCGVANGALDPDDSIDFALDYSKNNSGKYFYAKVLPKLSVSKIKKYGKRNIDNYSGCLSLLEEFYPDFIRETPTNGINTQTLQETMSDTPFEW